MVNLQVSFESLIEAITSLSLEEKNQLLEILEDQIFEAEEDLVETDPQVLAEIEEARKDYQNGNYVTIITQVATEKTK